MRQDTLSSSSERGKKYGSKQCSILQRTFMPKTSHTFRDTELIPDELKMGSPNFLIYLEFDLK